MMINKVEHFILRLKADTIIKGQVGKRRKTDNKTNPKPKHKTTIQPKLAASLSEQLSIPPNWFWLKRVCVYVFSLRLYLLI